MGSKMGEEEVKVFSLPYVTVPVIIGHVGT